MRVLIISDVHGNWEALQAVMQEPHDHLMFLGDVVHFGPDPRTCVEFLQNHVTWAVRGNHDHGAGYGEDCRAYGPWQTWDAATRIHTDRVLTDEHRAYLRSLPLVQYATIAAMRFCLVHAAPGDPLYQYLPADVPEDTLAVELVRANADVLLVGHTHIPVLRRIRGQVFVNPGSVGMPRNGTHAHYAIWEDGRIRLRSCSYDIAAVVKRLRSLDLPVEVFAGLTDALQGRPGEDVVDPSALRS